ncbi:MAG: acetyl-CoA carboxylase biotin carboxyl carrier protein [Spirochaetaceae bacterium]|jgi:acetyl-CoA carboxylase biotin carboxyl carrier protein|nr:acetyl-CoA carboxylase biotin carboxyl carrier protein [Spirochaetaceae bacterium]
MNEKLLFSLIDRFEAGSLTELEYLIGDQRLTLKKGGAAANVVQGAVPMAAPQGVPHAAPAGVPLREGAPPEVPNTSAAGKPEVITSPLVATFYASNMPDAPPFVQVGDKVKKGQTLCILEAMKMMNKLDAEADCEILAVKARPGDLVEFGQALFEIKTR